METRPYASLLALKSVRPAPPRGTLHGVLRTKLLLIQYPDMPKRRTCREIIFSDCRAASVLNEAGPSFPDKALQRAEYRLVGFHYVDGSSIMVQASFEPRVMSEQEYEAMAETFPPHTHVKNVVHLDGGQEIQQEKHRITRTIQQKVQVMWRSTYFLIEDLSPQKVLQFFEKLLERKPLLNDFEHYFKWEENDANRLIVDDDVMHMCVDAKCMMCTMQ